MELGGGEGMKVRIVTYVGIEAGTTTCHDGPPSLGVNTIAYSTMLNGH